MLTRRQLVAGAGLGAGFWNLVRAKRAYAAGAPLRLVILPMLNGAEPRFFWPNPGNLAGMSTVTQPLAPYQRQITFVRGINIEGSNNHMAVRSIFTGAPIPDYLSPDPSVKSVDQVVADHVATSGATRLRSLHLGVIPADSIQFYKLYGRSTFFFSPRALDYEANPVTAFERTFRGFNGPATPAPGPAPMAPGPDPALPMSPPMTPMPTPPAGFDKETLAIAEAELAALSGRLGQGGSAADVRKKLELHKQALATLRAQADISIPMPPPAPPMPAPPAPVVPDPGPPAAPPMGEPVSCDSSRLPSVEKLRSALAGNEAAAYQHRHFSDIFDAQIDIATRALVCGLTRVATIQAGSADGNVTVPVGGGLPHHNTSHGNQDTFAQVQRFYAGKLLRLLRGLDVRDPLDPAGRTVLYNSVVLWMAECLPVGHGSDEVPVLLAGNAGGALKAGSLVNVRGASNKTLMKTILQVLGASGGGHFGGQSFGELRA